jgi:riboflavin synthase
MFTGIIEATGRVVALTPRETGARVTIRSEGVLSGARPGSSIAVNGVCLTALDLTAETFSADLAPETLRRTNLGRLEPGHWVNLERPLAADGRLDGHIVQGHVDGTAELIRLEELGDGNWWLTIRLPEVLLPQVVEKGSIALDGISLTVAGLEGPDLSVAIIPHTYQATNLRSKSAGDPVNVETDILAKHVARLLEFARR